ncbi:hypothetical protein BS78_04G037200 [Paspalum vaginatum]|nr:hypothetical protein BS78_04G037200 [Paspalum vaginatum]
MAGVGSGLVVGAALALAILLLLLCLAPPAAAAEVVAAPGTSSSSVGAARTEAEARAMYDLWLARHGRAHGAPGDGGEYERRFRTFWDNLRFVDAHNAAGAHLHGYRLGMNRFADLTNEEFRAAYVGTRRGGGRNATVGDRYRHDGVEALPEFVDWRQEGAVAPVKNQGYCGSCWAFSTIGAVEGINQIVTGELVTLSEQELVECNGQNGGCDGGWERDAFAFIAGIGGIDTDRDYPYTARDGKCDSAKLSRPVVSIDGFEDVPPNDDKALQKAVAHQPVSVAIEAGSLEFQLYESGVLTCRCGATPDHAVVAVGYGTTEDGQDYWLVRNSWSADWGDAGYIRVGRNVRARGGGDCGVTMEASYPVKTGPNPDVILPPPPVASDATRTLSWWGVSIFTSKKLQRKR